jgi:hypothetical protein
MYTYILTDLFYPGADHILLRTDREWDDAFIPCGETPWAWVGKQRRKESKH